MSDLMILSDAEIDAVSGGILNAGNGGNGGSAIVGGNISVTATLSDVDISHNDLSVERSSARANGGRGGDVRIRVRL